MEGFYVSEYEDCKTIHGGFWFGVSIIHAVYGDISLECVTCIGKLNDLL